MDGWGRYTRRRKWYRDAELVEISASTEVTPSPTPTRDSSAEALRSPVVPSDPPPEYAESVKSMKSIDSAKSSGFRPGSIRRRGSKSRGSSLSHASDDDRPHTRREADWGIGDDARMGLE